MLIHQQHQWRSRHFVSHSVPFVPVPLKINLWAEREHHTKMPNMSSLQLPTKPSTALMVCIVATCFHGSRFLTHLACAGCSCRIFGRNQNQINLLPMHVAANESSPSLWPVEWFGSLQHCLNGKVGISMSTSSNWKTTHFSILFFKKQKKVACVVLPGLGFMPGGLMFEFTVMNCWRKWGPQQCFEFTEHSSTKMLFSICACFSMCDSNGMTHIPCTLWHWSPCSSRHRKGLALVRIVCISHSVDFDTDCNIIIDLCHFAETVGMPVSGLFGSQWAHVRGTSQCFVHHCGVWLEFSCSLLRASQSGCTIQVWILLLSPVWLVRLWTLDEPCFCSETCAMNLLDLERNLSNFEPFCHQICHRELS